MAAEFTLEDLLDSVADAVSALVLFANEAMTDKKKLTNLQEGVKIVQGAIDYFANDASRTIRMWREFNYESTYLSLEYAKVGERPPLESIKRLGHSGLGWPPPKTRLFGAPCSRAAPFR